MTWKTPKIVEVPVGMEINMYACAAGVVSVISTRWRKLHTSRALKLPSHRKGKIPRRRLRG
jgi:coenzyme PQQ precursor peptide PqqA